MSPLRVAAGLALTLLPAIVLAADPQLEAARQCTQLKDSLQRLVCYDKALADGSPPAAVSPPAAAQAPRPPRAAPQSPAPSAAAAVVAAPVVATAAPALGDESVKRSRKDGAVAAEPSNLEAKVTAARETRKDTYRVSLDNGQIWQQMDMSTLFHVAVGDTVRIEKGAMGGFRMALTGGHSGWVRVSRLQ
jgi:hypothetical protein